MGHASARLAFRCSLPFIAFIAVLLKSCENIFRLNILIQLQPRRFNIALCMGCKVIDALPQPDRRRKTLQAQKATAPSCRVVEILKQILHTENENSFAL